jgi:hypothetical protein
MLQCGNGLCRLRRAGPGDCRAIHRNRRPKPVSDTKERNNGKTGRKKPGRSR